MARELLRSNELTSVVFGSFRQLEPFQENVLQDRQDFCYAFLNENL